MSLPDHIVLASAGSLAVASVALASAVFQAWFFIKQPRQAWNGWGALMSAATALYASALFFNFNYPPSLANYRAEQCQYTGIIILLHGLYGFTLSYFSLKSRWFHLGGGLVHLILLVLLWTTPLILEPSFVARDLLWLNQPYIEPRLGPLGRPFLIYGLILAAMAVPVWMHLRRLGKPGFNHFIVGFFIWFLFALHDALATMGMPTVLFMMEYGFLGFIAAIMGFTMRSYQEMEKSLRQAQKMEALGTLAGGVAHDFNNILQALYGFAQIMLARNVMDATDRGYLLEMERTLVRAADMVKRLLTFGRKVQPTLKSLDMNQEVLQAVSLLERTIPRMIRIETNLAPDLLPTRGDPSQIDQVLINLAANAKDAMPNGGRLLFETSNLTLRDGRNKSALKLPPGDYVLLRISDDGPGMAKEIIERIFEPFFTTKGLGRGTGLGLSTAYGIVQSHGGTISCHSEVGQGTAFNVYLPASPKAQPVSPSPVPSSQQRLGGSETIMIVDDEDPIRLTVAESMEAFGYRVITAASGEEALRKYQEEQGRVDLVVLDLGMPGMGGRACLRRLRQQDTRIKVVVASGYLADSQPERLADMDVARFLVKPYRLAQLQQVIREVLDSPTAQPGT